MHRSLRLLGLAVPLAALSACTDQPVAPRTAAQADFTNNPAAGPRILYRGEAGPWSVVATDGRYLIAFFTAPIDRCGHQFPEAVADLQWQGDPETWVGHLLVQGKVNAYVIDLAGPVDCVVGAGSGRFVGWSEDAQIHQSDNAAGANPWDNSYTNVYRTVAEAALTTPSGGSGHVAALLHHVWHPTADAPRDNVHITVTEPGALAPSFGIANAPEETGIVVRAAFSDILIWGVPSAGLEVVMGADAKAFCELWDGGAGDPSPSFVSTMTYADKVLFDRILTVGQSRDVATQVWPYAAGELGGFCGMVLGGAAPLASGTTRGLRFFSDLGGTGNNADAALFTYRGPLTRPDGSEALFAFQMHWREGAPTKVTASLR